MIKNKITPHPKAGAAEFPETVRKPVQQEIARRCTYHTRLVKRGNTGLLTCVRETWFSCGRVLPSRRSSLQWRTFVSQQTTVRLGAASRAQHRFVSALWPSSCRFVPVAPRFASRFRLGSPPGSTLACITVLTIFSSPETTAKAPPSVCNIRTRGVNAA